MKHFFLLTAKEYAYTYDKGGNIKTETIGNTVHKYAYDSVWTDKLTFYDGKAITYDDLGRPTNYMGKSMTWDKAGKLTSVGNGVNYTYLSDGQRHTKTANGKTTTYNYNNGLLLSETNGDETLRYYYDSTGKIISFTYQKGTGTETSYFYTRNMQGDITAIYRNSDSKLIGTYEYDLWGKLVKAKEASTGIDTQGVLTKNPFRYRGYYYDTETGFYNLNARYYDPEVRRFISPDDVVPSAGTSVQGHNLFVYCFNDPVNKADPTGHWPRAITACLTGVAAVVAVVGVVCSAPIIAVGGAVAAVAFAYVYVAQSIHYDMRKALNTDIPEDEEAAAEAQWHGRLTDNKAPSAACHQYTAAVGTENYKYVSPDGHREAIYDNNGHLVLDSRDIGTYNFSPSGNLGGTLGHIGYDVIPWFVFGNDDKDPGPIMNEWNRTFN